MKFRFFLVLLLSLSTIDILLSISFNYYLNSERLELLDNQLKEIASALENSDLADVENINLSIGEGIISKVLGRKRIGKMFVIRNREGVILFKSASALLLNNSTPTSPEIFTHHVDDLSIRVLTYEFTHQPEMILQVGAFIDPTLQNWYFVSRKLLFYVVMSLISIIIFAYVLTNYLLEPLRLISTHLQQATHDLQNLRPVPSLPKKLIKYSSKTRFNNDEFTQLIVSTNDLLERININYKMTKPWSYQLAHEIKTPLSIISFDVEALRNENLKDPEIVNSMNEQISRISQTVSQFLEWASVENLQMKDNLFALKMAPATKAIYEELERLHPSRIRLVSNDDYTVIANPHHLQQLLTNILTNALNYSEASTIVAIESSKHTLIISDRGPGIPADVLERIGQPFNCGPSNPNVTHKRTGLGLAWINTLSKIYNWKLKIDSGKFGTVIKIEFPNDF